jgi:thiamine-phosphate pyrophosphorylase
MIHPHFPYRLYLVTNEAACMGRDLCDVIEAAIKGGVDLVQIREKKLSDVLFLEKALRIKEVLTKYRVPLIINDNLWVAKQSGADGIHVGNNDITPRLIKESWPACVIIGYSIEDEKQLQSPDAEVSDYLALSPIFLTPTKEDTLTEWKLEGVRHIRQLTRKPLVAIGAMNEQNAFSVIHAGADCLAVVSAICSAQDPQIAAERLRNQIEKAL